MSQKIKNNISIKCKLSNKLHRILEPNIDKKHYQRLFSNKKYSDEEKIKLFDEIKQLHDEISEEYSNCLYKNRMKKRVLKLRKEKELVNK